MTYEKLPDPVLVTRVNDLVKLAKTLASEPVIAVDTESNSLYAYQEQVCLIQFSTPNEDYLVDPLAVRDMSPLRPVFRNPQIEKIFHAAEYDLFVLTRDYGYEFNNLFDTMIAARILGRDALGLGSILEREFGVHLQKRYQRANWGQRPLPPDLLAYARLDTHYLIPLRDRLHADLQAEGRWLLAQEDFERLTHVNLNGRFPDDPAVQCWRIRGAHDLDPQQAAVLLELCKYRDKVARNQNRPLFKVISNRTLLAIAETAPANMRQLSQLPGMSNRQLSRHGRALLAATARGLQANPAYPPRSPRPDDDYLERVDRLRRWRKQTAREMGVKSDVVMPKDLLYEIAKENPSQQEELNQILSDVPWRRKRYGRQILDVLARM
ncbi:MAG: HRDC domain-containing protein [Anaerolineales bacterium]|jgi:ribonuclease D